MATTTWQKTHNNELDVDATDKHGNLDVNAPNPVNQNPKYNGDYPKPKPTTTKIKELHFPPASHTDSRPSAINCLPRQPGPALGPYFHFKETDLNEMIWFGSALIFRHISFERPTIEFHSKPKLDFSWELFYEKLFNMQIYRINISIEFPNGEGDDEINWKINWGDHISKGLFHIARYNQKWRGGFFSCNGFDASVTEEEKSKFKPGNVWEHLYSIHAETPLHLLIWGSYI
jgi:hypothetical protein